MNIQIWISWIYRHHKPQGFFIKPLNPRIYHINLIIISLSIVNNILCHFIRHNLPIFFKGFCCKLNRWSKRTVNNDCIIAVWSKFLAILEISILFNNHDRFSIVPVRKWSKIIFILGRNITVSLISVYMKTLI